MIALGIIAAAIVGMIATKYLFPMQEMETRDEALLRELRQIMDEAARHEWESDDR